MENLDQKILDAFVDVLPNSYNKTARGWYNFNCPSCGDTRGRGGFLMTSTGGFRYRCFNGGCDFNSQNTGWEPGSGLGGRPRELFQLLGGNPSDLPSRFTMMQADHFTKRGDLIKNETKEKPVLNFPRENLPDDTVSILDPGKFVTDKKYERVLDYLIGRGEEVAISYDFKWSPKFPNHLIIPYKHFDSVVGYLARSVLPEDKNRFFGPCPSDYIFGQDKVDLDGPARSVIVTEGVMDAIVLDGMACRNSSMTDKQKLFLNLCGRQKIILPDMERSGLNYVEIAEENNWYVSLPKWDRNVKDATEAVNRYGRLYTIESVVKGATKNYLTAKLKLSMKG
jgi:hypothetical protein